MSKEEKKNMSIANCRICLLSKSNCAECPLNWALVFKSGEYMNWLAIEAVKTDEILLNLKTGE